MENVYIQVQDFTGNWKNASILIVNDSQRILHEMRNVQMSSPNMRVRAVDENGRLLDMLEKK